MAAAPAEVIRPLRRVEYDRLVALGVFQSQTPQGAPDWPGLMAATLVAALPIIILFAIFGKKIVNNIQFSGIK